MTVSSARQFGFGLETEYLLVDADSFEPLWHQDLKFDVLNAALEGIHAAQAESDLGSGVPRRGAGEPGAARDLGR